MIYRRYKIEDYDSVCELWKTQKAKFLPFGQVPNTGFLVFSQDERLLASCFLYSAKTIGGHMGWLEWICLREDAKPREKKAALEGMMKQVRQHLQQFSYQGCFCAVTKSSLGKYLKAEKFKRSEDNLSTFIWRGGV